MFCYTYIYSLMYIYIHMYIYICIHAHILYIHRMIVIDVSTHLKVTPGCASGSATGSDKPAQTISQQYSIVKDVAHGFKVGRFCKFEADQLSKDLQKNAKDIFELKEIKGNESVFVQHQVLGDICQAPPCSLSMPLALLTKNNVYTGKVPEFIKEENLINK